MPTSAISPRRSRSSFRSRWRGLGWKPPGRGTDWPTASEERSIESAPRPTRDGSGRSSRRCGAASARRSGLCGTSSLPAASASGCRGRSWPGRSPSWQASSRRRCSSASSPRGWRRRRIISSFSIPPPPPRRAAPTRSSSPRRSTSPRPCSAMWRAGRWNGSGMGCGHSSCAAAGRRRSGRAARNSSARSLPRWSPRRRASPTAPSSTESCWSSGQGVNSVSTCFRNGSIARPPPAATSPSFRSPFLPTISSRLTASTYATSPSANGAGSWKRSPRCGAGRCSSRRWRAIPFPPRPAIASLFSFRPSLPLPTGMP